MTMTLLAGLLAQAVSLALLRHRLGRRWLRRPVVLFMIASTVELGVAPALLTIPSIGATDAYAIGVRRSFIDEADLIMSVVMLGFTVAYLLTRPELAAMINRRSGAETVSRVLDWRILAPVCVAMALVTAAGKGYADGNAAGAGTPLATNLVATFFIVVIAAASVAFLVRFGIRWFLPVLIVQSILLALAGERTPVLADALALVVVLLFIGVRIPRRQLVLACVLTIAAVFAISGVRTQEGRSIFYTNSGLAGRITALGDGLLSGGSPVSGPATPGLVAQFATRESGVDFAGAVLQSISAGQPRLSATYVPESLLLNVPSFLWKSKLDNAQALNPAQLEIDDFGLQQINYIPGMVGTYIGMLTLPWLLLLFGFLGCIFGWFERWLLRECTPARVILLAGAVSAALLYEAGLPTVLVQMRAAAVLALAVKFAEMARYGRISFSRRRPARVSLPRLPG
jgi:hypothetical protein